jgi:FKBP-type peptidyl-prolyl cis-trans isomerase (trigger factor)
MGVQKTLKKAGDGQSYPQKGDEVTIDYKGYIRNSDGSKGKL